MDISSYKQAKPHMKKKLGLRKGNRKRISNSNTKQHHNEKKNVKVDNMQQNGKSRLCGDRDETSNHISNCCELA